MNAAAKAIHQSSLFEGSLAELRVSKELFITLLLALAIIATALAVIYSTDTYRSVLNKVEVAKRQNHQLHMRSGKLLLEQASLSSAYRVEKLAKEQMGMVLPVLKKSIA